MVQLLVETRADSGANHSGNKLLIRHCDGERAGLPANSSQMRVFTPVRAAQAGIIRDEFIQETSHEL
jgi:hypothetical protein